MKKRVLVLSTCGLGITTLVGVGGLALNKVSEINNQKNNSFGSDIEIINQGYGNIEITTSDNLTLFFDDNKIYQKGDIKVNYFGAINDYQVYKLDVELDPILNNYITITNNSWKIGESLILNAYYKEGMNPTNSTMYHKMVDDLKDSKIKLTFSITYYQKESNNE